MHSLHVPVGLLHEFSRFQIPSLPSFLSPNSSRFQVISLRIFSLPNKNLKAPGPKEGSNGHAIQHSVPVLPGLLPSSFYRATLTTHLVRTCGDPSVSSLAFTTPDCSPLLLPQSTEWVRHLAIRIEGTSTWKRDEPEARGAWKLRVLSGVYPRTLVAAHTFRRT